ncbi:MAG: sigma-70 family RNA polymerase sigma factor [Steroidobacteraceae bacterium]
MTDRNREITALVTRERSRLATFIRRRVSDPLDAEDVLQDVLHDFVRAYRLPEPIEQAGAWLFRVARNRIIDRFRRRKTRPAADVIADPDDDGEYRLDLPLPAREAGPDALMARSAVLEALQSALEELPAEQREVFIAHEIDGSSFREIALRTGVAVNTLLARKRYAIRRLRARLQPLYDELDI